MLLYILLGLAVIIVLILVIAATKPNTVRYERSTVIHAAPERILPHLIDFRAWQPWSPWEKLDPDMERNYSGTDRGVGAKYAWSGKKAGAGTMEVLAVDVDSVDIDLRFTRPFKNDCVVWFRCAPQGADTKLIWTMDGPQIFMGKVMSVFMNMEKMIGKDFETGLAGLKREAENP
ncbi:MAG: SRPBCC family protein [Flavobacteriales bacterium]|nr:SRPBCC family protein [Flavobacteriales bacterium]